MSKRQYVVVFLLVLLAGGVLRTLWLRADPPTTSVDIVWHDEGAWIHNARNRALWGIWRTDNWNPVFIAPVFTALEYAAFETFGVGTWQARTVPVASGLLGIAALMMGLSAVWRSGDERIGYRVAAIGGIVLAVNYMWTMWNRAALMESTMTAFIVVAWAAYAMGERRPFWGFVAGLATVLAWFTKAAAAFFVAALVVDAVWVIATDRVSWLRDRLHVARPEPHAVRTAWLALAGLAAAGAVVIFVFVLPHWSDYQFYNWQMSVTRKPSYDFKSLKDRVTWLPLAQDILARMWLVFVGAAIAVAGVAARWRHSKPGERLLVLWLLLGLLELAVHDTSGRRYVMLLPAIIGLAAGLAGSGANWFPADLPQLRLRSRLIAVPLLAALGYLVAASLIRWIFREQIDNHVGENLYRAAVRFSVAISLIGVAAVLTFWSGVTRWVARRRITPRAAVILVVVSVAWNVAEYVEWAAHRGDFNYRASVAVGQLLPPGTLVQGKLANGLSLENRIRPIFVGHEFGNYADRLTRDDARYILTYGLPEVGFESYEHLIQEILDHYPNRRLVATFTVDETPEPDEAWLLDKQPGLSPAAVSGSNRAPD